MAVCLFYDDLVQVCVSLELFSYHVPEEVGKLYLQPHGMLHYLGGLIHAMPKATCLPL